MVLSNTCNNNSNNKLCTVKLNTLLCNSAITKLQITAEIVYNADKFFCDF